MSKENNAKDTEVFVISVAAELAGMHAQTLRSYDRMGLVTPRRTRGGGRRYTKDDVEQLREIQRLSHDEGVNLAGIKAITRLQEEKSALEAKLTELEAENEALREKLERAPRRGGELVHVPSSTAVVVWKRRR
ncbi:MAG: MerR family transcriptional regulator [Corynebacterium glucuronolyticum]|nr:MerR family transcriptional regulator [Mycobacteriaceae bacterium]MDY5834592.1 MerR family transcriptional regulator [Corynebacterium glucuronolyticum]